MKYKKYRDLNIKPNQINFQNINILKVINYMPAGNDVLECTILYNNCVLEAFLKIERSKMADFASEIYNLNYLNNDLDYNKIPVIYEYGNINDKYYIVLEKLNGKLLSEIINNNSKNKNEYLEKYGKELGIIHKIAPNNFNIAKQRIINDNPNKENYNLNDAKIKKYLIYLRNNKPCINYDTFIHGDFHYANILWKSKNISGVLDWEYAGRGFKEQDIAWAITYRMNQLFLDNLNDIKCFLKGYKKENNYDEKKLKWCLINSYLHFYLMNNDINYKNKLLELLKIISTL